MYGIEDRGNSRHYIDVPHRRPSRTLARGARSNRYPQCSITLEVNFGRVIVPARGGQLLKPGQDLALRVGYGQTVDPSRWPCQQGHRAPRRVGRRRPE
jgi:hypothetical protein